jgi:hypothetical protein
MSTKPFIITANGNYELKTSIRTNTTIIYVSGAMGTATATVTYKDLAGAYQPLSSGALTTGDQYPVGHGQYQDIYLTVAGANGSTAIEINAVAS